MRRYAGYGPVPLAIAMMFCLAGLVLLYGGPGAAEDEKSPARTARRPIPQGAGADHPLQPAPRRPPAAPAPPRRRGEGAPPPPPGEGGEEREAGG
jgi:hypothetical protein